jgi:hypothetical protein
MIDSREAQAALADINDMVVRVRQSRIYEIASLIMIVAGVLVVIGNLATIAAPRYGYTIWIGINVLSILSVAGISLVQYRRTGVRAFDFRVLAAFLFFYAFGVFANVLGHFGWRETTAFWPLYYMLFYCLAGLWFGRAFLAIGLGIIALTLIGYFFITGVTFLLWMAAANGGGLILSGFWMRWGE